MSYGAENIQEQNQRMERLNRLYFEDGRDKATHPQHGLFTGLHAAVTKEVCPQHPDAG